MNQINNLMKVRESLVQFILKMYAHFSAFLINYLVIDRVKLDCIFRIGFESGPPQIVLTCYIFFPIN